jgi:hypothetical protein
MNTTPAGVNSADVRAWAIVNGFPQLAGRNGRLPKDAIERYVAVHGVAVPEPVTVDGAVMPPEPQGVA